MKEGIIEKVIMGGEGLLRDEFKKVVFIPYALEGETLSYTLTEEKKDFNRGQIIKILKPHALRITPKCPHFSFCEGCQLQQAPIDLQRAMKREWLLDQFRRTCKVEPPTLEAMDRLQEWHYRRVVDWHWEKNEIGYRNSKGELVPITTCELVRDSKANLVKVKALMQNLSIEKARIRLIYGKKQLFVIELPSLEKASSVIEKAASLWPLDGLDGLHITSNHKSLCHFGEEELEEDILGLNITWHAQGFLQNHLEGSRLFYKWLESRMEGPKNPSNWIDLYCGTGVTSLLAARMGWKVFGYEISSPAIKMARQNASKNNLKCTFDVKDLNKSFFRSLPKNKIGGILVNPPRTGLSKPVIEYIKASTCQKILYLSCDPVTLCRDMKTLLAFGYSLKAWKAFDCFAQTSHFETATELELTHQP